MRKELLPAVLLIAALLLAGVIVAYAFDTSDTAMPFQGSLANSSGVPVADGNYTITFTIYRDSVGGPVLWTETQTVATKGGMFSVKLGSINPIPDSAISIDTVDTIMPWLGIKVGIDQEMTPRTKLGATPYARFSRGVEGHIMTKPGSLKIPDSTMNRTGFKLNIGDFLHGGSQLLMYGADTTSKAIEMRADTSGGHLVMINTGDADKTTMDAHGLSYFVGGVEKATFGADTSGGHLVMFNTVDNIKTKMDAHQLSYFVSAEEKATFGANDSGGHLVMIDTFNGIKTKHDAHGISFFTGAKESLAAGLSPSGLTLTTGASDGYVLTSDALGLGTWKPIPTLGGCWLCPTGNYTYLSEVSDSVGIGTSTPKAKLDVTGDIRTTGSLILPSGLGRIKNYENNRAILETYWNATFGDYTAINSGYDWDLVHEPISMVAGNYGVFFMKGTSGTPYTTQLAKIDSAGRMVIGTVTPTAKLDVVGTTGYNQVRMRTSYTPTGTADANGNVGDVAWDANYFYVKTAAGWKRAALGTW